MRPILLILLLIVAACSSGPAPKSPVETPEILIPSPGPVFDPGIQGSAIEVLKPVATVIEFINHTDLEKERNTKAIEKVRETVRGQCFKDALLKRALIQTGGKTNEQVLHDILSGDVKIRLSMYRSWKSTIGYTYPSSDTIWCNRKYHDNMGPCDVGANLIHEISHKIGYGHDYKPNKQRPFSVPYSVGSLMDDCCQEIK